MKRCIIMVVAVAAIAVAATRVYDVELSQNDNATTPEGGWVGQTFIAVCDSIEMAAFFVGRACTSGYYRMGIYDSTGNQIQGQYIEDSAAGKQYQYITGRFSTSINVCKGRKYMLKIWHSGGDPVNYYLNDSNRYAYGELFVGGQKSTGLDLAARIDGATRVPKHIFAVQSCMPEPEKEWPSDTANWHKLSARHYLLGAACDKIGMSYWNYLQKYDTIPASRWPWGWCDSVIALEASNGVQCIWQFNTTANWARSTKDSVYCVSLPINLFQPVLSGDTIDRRNFWAYYVYNMYKRYGVNGTFWSSRPSLPYLPIIINTPCEEEPEHDLRGARHWQSSKLKDTVGGYKAMCDSLGADTSFYKVYSRLLQVTHVACRKADTAHKTYAYTTSLWGNDSGIGPDRTLGLLKYYGGADSVEGYSYHDYWDEPKKFEASLDTITAALRKHGEYHKGFYLSEGGYPAVIGPGQNYDSTAAEKLRGARLLKIYAGTIGDDHRLRKPVDRFVFFTSNARYHPDHIESGDIHRWGLTDTSPNFYVRSSGWGYDQMTDKLSGQVYNTRLFNSLTAETCRIYEFQNPATKKRTWVAWKKQGVGGDSIEIRLPAKTNDLYKVKLAYSSSLPESSLKHADNFGWFTTKIDTNPVYIREDDDTSRADLICDSIWLSPHPPRVNNPVTFYARLKNVGNAPMAVDTNQPPYVDSVCFYVNGVRKSDTVLTTQLNSGDTLTVEGRLTWTPDSTGAYLLKTVINRTKVHMELSFDNNARYRMYDISYLPPTGSVKINADEPFTNTHYGVLHLDSYNPNKADSAYADYMRITQYTVSGGETTEYSSTWVDFDPHFKWRLCQNQGKNVVYAQFKIDEGNLTSSVYKDSILVDWTYPETLKMVINHDSLFTSDTTCTLCCHAVDLISGICQMRFGNDSLVNLVREGDMSSSSRWLWNHATYHDSLDLFEMEIQDDSCYLYQQIQKDSILAKDPNCYNGDTLQISGDLVLDHLKASARLEARLIFRLSGPGTDTLLGVVPCGASIDLPDTTLSRTARYNFYSQFAFKPESTGYDFKRIEIGIYSQNTQGVKDTGKIYVDNIRLDPVKPKHAYSPFVGFDTTKLWCLDSVNNKQVVFAQYQDSAGNESHVVWDSITVDTVHPSCQILSPYDSQTVSSTVTITGHAHDSVIHPPHFWKYNLDYLPNGSETWYPVKPDSMSTTPVYPVLIGMPDSLGHWWTDSVANGHYDLRVLVKDKARNEAVYTVHGLYVSNAEPPGGGGDGFGGFGGEAEAMSLDKDDNLYLISTETPADQIDIRVRKYSATGESLLSFSAKLATDSTRIPWPSGLVIDDSSRIFLLDGLNNCLKVFDKTGKFLVKVGSRGSGQAQFIDPSDLKWDGSGKTRLFITDKGNKRVQVLSKQGGFLRQFGTDSIALNDPVALGHNTYNQTCVLDVKNDTGKLFVYDSTGKLRRTVTSFNLKNPTALALDSKDNIFIADAGNKRILELSPNLTHIYSFGTEGDSFGQFRNPTALSITKDRRYLYVYDRTKKTISKFTMIKSKKHGGGGGQSEELTEILPTQLLLYAPKPNPAKRIVTLKYAVPRQEKISLVIYDIVGRQARTITNKLHKPGYYIQTWDGKDDRGNELAAGVYFCLLKDNKKILTKKAVLVR